MKLSNPDDPIQLGLESSPQQIEGHQRVNQSISLSLKSASVDPFRAAEWC